VKTLIYGSRPDGQANVIAALARELGGFELVGLVDDFAENRDRTVGGLRVIGSGADLSRLRDSAEAESLLIGFGESRGRAEAVERVVAAGLEQPRLVHPSAVRLGSTELGRGIQLLPHAYMGPNARIGDGVLGNTAAIVEHDVVLESGAVVLPHATVSGRVRVGRDATIGAGAVVLPDVAIGAGAVVGGGAVVIRDVAPGERVAGVPARPLEAK